MHTVFTFFERGGAMKMRIYRLLLVGFVVTSMVLSACEAAQNQTPVSISSPALATSTFTPLNSTPHLTQITGLSSTSTAIPEATENNTEFVQDNCSTYGMPPAQTSPDGAWLASACFDGEDAHVRIARFDHAKAWDLNFKDVTGASPCLSHGNSYGDSVCFYGILYIDHWYKAGRYVFVSADYLIDRNSTFSFGLYRIDIESGHVSAYLPVGSSTYNYAFSPSDERYAYVTGSDNYLLHIVSLETGQNSTYTVPGSYSSLGELIWSPSNDKLVFQTQGIGWEENSKVGFSLDIFDIQNEKFRTVISNDVRRFKPTEWLSFDSLLLHGFSDDGQSYIQYQFTISDNQLVVIPNSTPTP